MQNTIASTFQGAKSSLPIQTQVHVRLTVATGRHRFLKQALFPFVGYKERHTRLTLQRIGSQESARTFTLELYSVSNQNWTMLLRIWQSAVTSTARRVGANLM
jgi:hypothetical protein